MQTFLAILSFGLAGTILWLGINVAVERPKFEIFRNVRVALPVVIVAGLVYVFYCRGMIPALTSGFGGAGDVIIVISLLAGLNLPSGLLLGVAMGNGLAQTLTSAMSGAIGLRNLPSCDKAQAFEKREDFVQAERCYREFLAKAETEKVADEDLAPGRLAFGNLLQRLGRMDEAALQWEKASAGTLLAEQAQVAALRASDYYLRVGRADHARRLLTEAIGRHPTEPVTRTLRERLAALGAPSGLGMKPPGR